MMMGRKKNKALIRPNKYKGCKNKETFTIYCAPYTFQLSVLNLLPCAVLTSKFFFFLLVHIICGWKIKKRKTFSQN